MSFFGLFKRPTRPPTAKAAPGDDPPPSQHQQEAQEAQRLLKPVTREIEMTERDRRILRSFRSGKTLDEVRSVVVVDGKILRQAG